MPDRGYWIWSWRTRDRVDGSELRITEAMGSGAARVFDYLRYTQQLTTEFYRPLPPSKVIAWVGLGTTWTCGACAASLRTSVGATRFQKQVWIAGGADQAYWSDAVTAHEFGHTTMSTYGVTPGEAGTHIIGVPVQPGMAWSEGWATYFSSEVRNNSLYYDKQAGGFFWFDIDLRVYSMSPPPREPWLGPSPSGGLFQAIDENEVAAMTWALTGVLSRDAVWSALASPRMTVGPFERGYTRRTWSDPTMPEIYTDTGVNAPMFADFLDELVCAGADPATVDLVTQPADYYPYPSGMPLCR
jgi:hypothetical protein